ncbi:hypothetical protein [Mesorhizobium sp. WSM3860]|uniref:hypothetical protein n=1 Tax=Mesorhizobium sp. WSM3860 TaxID=2029403 RepID=UPI000BB08FDC|nr:hypothetical protein [Mesorhizobium sp. WSM3860]PBC02523.1 hypothetical protein CK220_20660 [Mesorhizobium sp. WSM3860]
MQKWEVIRIFCDFLPNPHDKFCICICPQTNLFMFINSDPPQFRKARELAITIDIQEAGFLHHLSYVDTTKLTHIPKQLVQQALGDPARHHGMIAPFLRTRVRDAVSWNDVMEQAHRDKVLED